MNMEKGISLIYKLVAESEGDSFRGTRGSVRSRRAGPESPELSRTMWNHHLIRKLAQCRQMYCVIYSCPLADPAAVGGLLLARTLQDRPRLRAGRSL